LVDLALMGRSPAVLVMAARLLGGPRLASLGAC
jgi:hypothetical protein